MAGGQFRQMIDHPLEPGILLTVEKVKNRNHAGVGRGDGRRCHELSKLTVARRDRAWRTNFSLTTQDTARAGAFLSSVRAVQTIQQAWH